MVPDYLKKWLITNPQYWELRKYCEEGKRGVCPVYDWVFEMLTEGVYRFPQLTPSEDILCDMLFHRLSHRVIVEWDNHDKSPRQKKMQLVLCNIDEVRECLQSYYMNRPDVIEAFYHWFEGTANDMQRALIVQEMNRSHDLKHACEEFNRNLGELIQILADEWPTIKQLLMTAGGGTVGGAVGVTLGALAGLFVGGACLPIGMAVGAGVLAATGAVAGAVAGAGAAYETYIR